MVVYFEHEEGGRKFPPFAHFFQKHYLIAILLHGLPESVSLMTKNVSEKSHLEYERTPWFPQVSRLKS